MLIQHPGTPLHFAARCPSHEVVRLLVEEYKANVSLTLLNGSQALHSATTAGSGATAQHVHGETGAVISTLIEAGSDVNVRNGTGRTPLHWAVEWGNLLAVQALLERGARVDVREEETNMIPLDIAKMNFMAEPEYSAWWKYRKEVLEELEKRG